MSNPAPSRPRREPSPKRPAQRSRRQRDANGNGNGNDVGQSIYVANLPWKATEQDVERLFGRFGEVHQATIIIDRRTGRSKGFGFVDMPRQAATTAIEELNGSNMGGRDLKVRSARPRHKRG